MTLDPKTLAQLDQADACVKTLLRKLKQESPDTLNNMLHQLNKRCERLLSAEQMESPFQELVAATSLIYILRATGEPDEEDT